MTEPTYWNTLNDLSQKEYELKKQYIGYDKLVDNAIAEKRKSILELEINILALTKKIASIKNDIARIETERNNNAHTACGVFVNVAKTYEKMTSK
jgi:hypothetical protein